MTAESETEKLANYIMAEIPGEPAGDDGAGGTAIRIMKTYRIAMIAAMNELGVPDGSYPAPVANAYDMLKQAVEGV